MKNLTKLSAAVVVAASCFLYSSCDKNSSDEPTAPKLMETCTDQLQMSAGASVSASSPYSVHISDLYKDGDTWVWIWEIKNTKPGNGTGGTVQDLSHWGIDLGKCVGLDDIVEAAYSQDKVNWTTFEPKFEEDKSQDCSTNKYVKFDFGTTGGQSSYYRMIITKNVPHVDTEALYKSGTNTGCGVFETCGFGCPKEQ
jgi:hypothetical protein